MVDASDDVVAFEKLADAWSEVLPESFDNDIAVFEDADFCF